MRGEVRYLRSAKVSSELEKIGLNNTLKVITNDTSYNLIALNYKSQIEKIFSYDFKSNNPELRDEYIEQRSAYIDMIHYYKSTGATISKARLNFGYILLDCFDLEDVLIEAYYSNNKVMKSKEKRKSREFKQKYNNYGSDMQDKYRELKSKFLMVA